MRNRKKVTGDRFWVLGYRKKKKDMGIKSYKDLEVWQKSMTLVKQIYLVTKKFPKEEQYGLVNQMRRSAVSIPSNIAEGKARHHLNEYIQFLFIALGSSAELETQTIIARELKYFSESEADKIIEEITQIAKMIRSLVNKLGKSVN